MIIDAHIHLDIYSNKFIPLKKRILDLKRLMRKNKISKSIVISSTEKDRFHPSMQDLVSLLKKEKDIYLIGTIEVTKHTKKDLKELEDLLKYKKIIGIKLYPGYEKFYPCDKRCDKIYDLCEIYNVPVIFHTGETFGEGNGMKYAKPEHVDEVAVKRPNLKIIIAHMGNPWINDTMVILSRHKNVYADISGLIWKSFDSFWRNYYGNEISKVLKYCSNHNKLIFGTDWPCHDESMYFKFHKQYISFVKSLKICKRNKEEIFSLNAKKLFGLR